MKTENIRNFTFELIAQRNVNVEKEERIKKTEMAFDYLYDIYKKTNDNRMMLLSKENILKEIQGEYESAIKKENEERIKALLELKEVIEGEINTIRDNYTSLFEYEEEE